MVYLSTCQIFGFPTSLLYNDNDNNHCFKKANSQGWDCWVVRSLIPFQRVPSWKPPSENLPAFCYSRQKSKRKQEMWSHREEGPGSSRLVYPLSWPFLLYAWTNTLRREIVNVFAYQQWTTACHRFLEWPTLYPHHCTILLGPTYLMNWNLDIKETQTVGLKKVNVRKTIPSGKLPLTKPAHTPDSSIHDP